MNHSKKVRNSHRMMLLLILCMVVWFISVTVMALLYTNYTCSEGCSRNVHEQQLPVEILPAHAESAQIPKPPINNGQRHYSHTELHRWRPARPVGENKNSPGEMGTAVNIPPEDEDKKKKLFKLNQFNLMASDMIALNRSLKDVRIDACKSKELPKYLPDTSIIIIFYNEAWSTLLRTVWSVINRSPRILLKEIILVDDASEREHLKQKLEDYVKTLPVPIFVIRNQQRSGLVKARLLGAKRATGQVLTFLDSHCECTQGWLEPLLARIVEDRRTVVVPVVDIISHETFEYKNGDVSQWGVFTMQIEYDWAIVPQREHKRRNGDHSMPLRTPTMIGGLFSIDRDYFYEIGAYDDKMLIWGSENIEMSFRIWQCGGTLELHPCSHVGHVYRSISPYSFPGGTDQIILHNGARVAEVWMDDWKDYYYITHPGARNVSIGDISERVELRKNLKCKSFRWYLENIYPESKMPYDGDYLGAIQNVKMGNCLDTMNKQNNEPVGLGACHQEGGNQMFMYRKRHQAITWGKLCLDATSPPNPVNLINCHDMRGNQEWSYNEETKMIKHTITNRCLSAPRSGDLNKPVLADCDLQDDSQKWMMEIKFKLSS